VEFSYSIFGIIYNDSHTSSVSRRVGFRVRLLRGKGFMIFKRFKCWLFGHLHAMHVVKVLANGQSLMVPTCMRCNDFAKSIEAAELNYKLVEQEFRIAYVKWIGKFEQEQNANPSH
jgi:hypothetical protein